MLVLEAGEVCPFTNKCPYNLNNTCHGTYSNRTNQFTCTYVVNGKISEQGSIRNQHDMTGKMQIINEG